MPCVTSSVGLTGACALLIAIAVGADSTRQLTPEEVESLTQTAAQLEPAPMVIDGAIITNANGSLTGDADVSFQPHRVERVGCIAAHVVFHGHSDEANRITWVPAPVTATFDYWPNRTDCSARDLTGSIRLHHLMDSDTLTRLLANEREIFVLANSRLQRMQEGGRSSASRIVSIDLSPEPDMGYVYKLHFWDGTCSGGMSVLLRLRPNDFDIIDATQIVC